MSICSPDETRSGQPSEVDGCSDDMDFECVLMTLLEVAGERRLKVGCAGHHGFTFV
jgi:hypothetical protein